MKKIKYFLDFEKEEKWLNEMAQQGFELTKKSIAYHFRSIKPKNANIKIDYRTFKKRDDFEDYKALFEDCGWKHISGSKSSGAQYFKQEREDADIDIFSDIDSKAGRYKRLSELYASLAVVYLLFFTATNKGLVDFSAILNPKLLYYTPGLWEKTGETFWKAFLFETPFALLRGLSWGFLAVMFILYLITSMRSQRLYKKTKESKTFDE